MSFHTAQNPPRTWRRLIPIAAIVVLVIGLLLPYLRRRDSDRYTRVDLKSLGFFEMDQDTGTLKDIPAEYVALDGKNVCLEGFMWSDEGAPSVNAFQLVYNIHPPGPRGPPLVQERVFAKTSDGKNVPLIGDFVRARGILHVKVKHSSGGKGPIESIYEMSVDSVFPPDSEPPKSHYIQSIISTSISISVLVLIVWTYNWLIAFSSARRRAAAGKCPVCGYDLRATPNRCSECGNVPSRY